MLSLDGIPLLGTLVRLIPAVPDSGDLGRLSNPLKGQASIP